MCHLIKNSSLYKLVKKNKINYQSIKIAKINRKSSTKKIKIQQSIKIYTDIEYYRLIQTYTTAKRIHTSTEV